MPRRQRNPRIRTRRVSEDTNANGVGVPETVEIQAEPPQPLPSDPHPLRLKVVLSMVVRGKTQRQIAAHFGRDERTVRRWIAQAKDQRLALSGDLVPDDVVAEFMEQFLDRKADLLDLKREAEAAGDFAARVICIRELLRAESVYLASLAKIGFFDGYRYVPRTLIDPEVEGANHLKKSARQLVKSRSSGKT